MPNQPIEKPGPHHPHKGHVPGDVDAQGHRDKSAPPTGTTEQPGAHHPHEGHTPGDLDSHGHRDTGERRK